MCLNINAFRPLPNYLPSVADRLFTLQGEELCELQTNTRISLNELLCPLSPWRTNGQRS